MYLCNDDILYATLFAVPPCPEIGASCPVRGEPSVTDFATIAYEGGLCDYDKPWRIIGGHGELLREPAPTGSNYRPIKMYRTRAQAERERARLYKIWIKIWRRRQHDTTRRP